MGVNAVSADKNGGQAYLSFHPSSNVTSGILVLSSVSVHSAGVNYVDANESLSITGGGSATQIYTNHTKHRPGSEGIANKVTIYKVTGLTTSSTISVQAACQGAHTIKAMLIK